MIPFISAFLYSGARNSSSRSSSGGAGRHEEVVCEVGAHLIWDFTIFTFGNDSGIHEGGERKVRDDKEGEDSLYCWNIRVLRPIISTSVGWDEETRSHEKKKSNRTNFHYLIKSLKLAQQRHGTEKK